METSGGSDKLVNQNKARKYTWYVGGKAEEKGTAFMKQKIYIDTSVVGGYFDDEFKEPTKLLFDRLVKEQVVFVISDLLELELIQAPEHVRELLDKFPVNYFERSSFNEEAEELALTYIQEKVIGEDQH